MSNHNTLPSSQEQTEPFSEPVVPLVTEKILSKGDIKNRILKELGSLAVITEGIDPKELTKAILSRLVTENDGIPLSEAQVLMGLERSGLDTTFIANAAEQQWMLVNVAYDEHSGLPPAVGSVWHKYKVSQAGAIEEDAKKIKAQAEGVEYKRPTFKKISNMGQAKAVDS